MRDVGEFNKDISGMKAGLDPHKRFDMDDDWPRYEREPRADLLWGAVLGDRQPAPSGFN